MQLPPSVTTLLGHVCRLRRALYGLKEVPHTCYERFHQSLLSAGYTQSMVDYAIFRCFTPQGIVLLIYMLMIWLLSGVILPLL